MKEPSSQNDFEVLSIPEEQVILVLEEGEFPQFPTQTSEEFRVPTKLDLNTPMEGHSPTYLEMEKKRNLWTILALQMKILLVSHPKKGENLSRRFGRKKTNDLRCREVNQL